jgi:hypothetical protein
MAGQISTFTHVGIKKKTKRKIAILAKAQGVDIYELVEYWANEDWKIAEKKGLVTKAMLELGNTAHWVRAVTA